MSRFGEVKRIDGELLCRLVKGRNQIDIVEDLGMDEDGWFLTVKRIKTKTGELKSESCIIRKNAQVWIDSYLREGYRVVDGSSTVSIQED